MQLNKLFKGFIIALPVVTMMACSSNNQDAMSEAEANKAAMEQAEADRRAAEEREAAAIAAQAQKAKDMKEMETRNTLDMLKGEQTVYFDFDTAKLDSDSYSTLAKHADFLAKNPGQSIVIEGHCDSRGTPEYNIALGERRAKSIETYLMNSGVSGSQISIVSYGEEKPAVNGTTEAAFAKNRRGVLVYQ